MGQARTSQAMRFHARAGEKVKERAPGRLAKGAAAVRRQAGKGMASLAEDGLEFEMRTVPAKNIRRRVLADLDVWLEIFEERATATGAEVLWARDGEEAAAAGVDIARREGVTKATKSKSMLSEEADLNEALAAAGIRPVETDLGEYIVQLAGEKRRRTSSPRPCTRPSAKLRPYSPKEHGRPIETRTSADIPDLAREARAVLRQHFLSAEMGISGANFLIAETVRRRWSPTKATAAW
jgi:L-lactate dehydrogenase complex protein LldF